MTAPVTPTPDAPDELVERAERTYRNSINGYTMDDATWQAVRSSVEVEAMGNALDAAGVPALVAEVDQWQRMARGAWRNEAHIAQRAQHYLARAVSAEQELAGLREAWALRRDDVIRVLNDTGVSFWDRINGADDLLRLPLAEPGGQVGEGCLSCEACEEDGQRCCGEGACRPAPVAPDSPPPGEHHKGGESALVVPDSAGLRERVWGVLADAAHRETWAGTDLDVLTDAVLASLADPVVVAGVAEAMQEAADGIGFPLHGMEADVLAQAVVEWITGGAS